MASSKEYLQYVLDQFESAGDVTSRAMMGEYLLYFRGKLFGGIYDDRVLVKPIDAAKTYMPDASSQIPYEGAKEMLLVEELDNKEYLADLLEAMYPELPEPKKKH